MEGLMSREFTKVRCPRCESLNKLHVKMIGEYRGTPCEGLEIGFWCRDCKKSILVSWKETMNGFRRFWRVGRS
jgi:transposase-like protein